MFGEVFDSVSMKINVANDNVQSLTLKFYPQIMHFWKSNRITMNIATNKNLRNTIKCIENIVNDDSECESIWYRYEYVFKGYTERLQNYISVVKFLNQHNDLPIGIDIKKTFSKEVYIQDNKKVLFTEKAKSLHGQGPLHSNRNLLQKF